jgi:hypothetical protein
MTPLAHNIAGWGDLWHFCPICDGDPDCQECGGEGGWPSTATRYDDEEDGE